MSLRHVLYTMSSERIDCCIFAFPSRRSLQHKDMHKSDASATQPGCRMLMVDSATMKYRTGPDTQLSECILCMIHTFAGSKVPSNVHSYSPIDVSSLLQKRREAEPYQHYCTSILHHNLTSRFQCQVFLLLSIAQCAIENLPCMMQDTSY